MTVPEHRPAPDPTVLTTSQILREITQLQRLIEQWQTMHETVHAASEREAHALRDAWRADAMQWRQNHDHSHADHKDAHEREHQLNQQAIDKAETSVDKAVGAARDTMGESMRGLSDRLTRAEEEQRRRMDEVNVTLHQLGLNIATLTRTAEGNVKGIQNVQDAQSWIVKIVGSAIVLALLGLILRPGLL